MHANEYNCGNCVDLFVSVDDLSMVGGNMSRVTSEVMVYLAANLMGSAASVNYFSVGLM